MHITYQFKEKLITIKDENIQNLLESKKSDEEKQKELIHIYESRIMEMNAEKFTITIVSVKFGHFLKVNAITPYNDAMEDYLEMLIGQERQKVDASVNKDRTNIGWDG